MKVTPKLDEIAARLEYATNIFSFMPHYVDRIDTNGEGYAKELLSGLKHAWEVITKNVITSKEVENELLGIYQDITDIPKTIAVVGTKFNQVGLSVDIDSYANMTNENVQRLNNISQIPENLRSDILSYLSLWGDYCQIWVEIIKSIISNLREYEQNYQKVMAGDIVGGTQPQQVQASTFLPIELQTDEAIKRFERAEKAGIIERAPTGYIKNGITKAQLAYFLQRIYQADTQSGAQFPDAKLSSLFGESRLGKAAGKLVDNNSGKPKGCKIIDDLFVD